MNVGLFRVDGAKSTPVGEPIRTDHDGAYQFPHLPTGDYRVEVTAVDSAWRFSPDNTGDDAADSDVSGGPPAESGRRVASSAIVSVDGQVTVVDAGLFKPAPASPDVSPSPSAPGTPAVDPSGSPAVAGVRASGGGRLPVTGSGITTMVGWGPPCWSPAWRWRWPPVDAPAIAFCRSHRRWPDQHATNARPINLRLSAVGAPPADHPATPPGSARRCPAVALRHRGALPYGNPSIGSRLRSG